MHDCLNAGCATKPDHTYNEICVPSNAGGTTGGTTGANGNPIPGPNGCPSGYDVYVEHGAISFACPNTAANEICTGSFGSEYIMHACLNAGCATKPDHTYNEMCIPSNAGGTTGGAHGTLKLYND